MTSTSTSTTTNEHYDKALEILNTAPRYRLDGPGDPHMPSLAIDTLEHHIREMAQQLADVQEVCRNLSEAEREYEAEHGAMAARIERLQRALVEARRRCNHLWLKSVPDSTPYDPIFQDYLERQLEPGDLLPVDGRQP